MAKDIMDKIKTIASGLVPPDDAPKPAAAPAADQPSWLEQVAVLTGVLAAVTGFLTVRSTTLTNDAIYESNQAVLSQTEASDAWTEYQADSIKARIIETQLLVSATLKAADKQNLTDQDTDLRARQPKIKQMAEDKLADRKTHLDNSQKRLGEKDLLGYASMAAQLGIAVASVAALTKRRIAFYAGIAAGVISILIIADAFISNYLLTH